MVLNPNTVIYLQKEKKEREWERKRAMILASRRHGSRAMIQIEFYRQWIIPYKSKSNSLKS